jgi:predicted nucleic acid-binding protein
MVKIIVDTSVWIEYFKNNKNYVHFIEENLDMENIYIVGPVIAELLHGVKSKKEFDILSESIEGIPFLDSGYNDWIKAGEILFELKKSGFSVPLTDTIIGAMALRADAAILTLDSHFKNIKDLKLVKL